jgi:hypothetical protein
MLAVIYVLWDAWRVPETSEEPGDHPMGIRQRLMDRVLRSSEETRKKRNRSQMIARVRHDWINGLLDQTVRDRHRFR